MARLVFLSHNSRDKPQVETLAFALRDAGIRPWLDKWELIAGRPWQEELAAALRTADAVVVCCGPHGLGKVQQPEIDLALDHAWRDVNRLVVPVLLPGAMGEVPDFLRLRTWVDLRDGISSAGVKRLVAALLGQAPGPAASEVGAVRPYQGLAAFEEKDAARFFGREPDVQALLSRLEQCCQRTGPALRWLTLVAASGAGKSSLLCAGLLPALRTGQLDGRYDWTILYLRPGPRPLHVLAVQLTRASGGSAQDLAATKAALSSQDNALSDSVDLFLPTGSAGLVLAVDQLEELFTQCQDREERAAFAANLLAAATLAGGQVVVVATLRADFLGAALELSRPFAAAIKASQEILLPLEPAQLQSAILRPAHQAGLRFDDGLVDTLIAEVGGQPGDLPLLQFTLDGLWTEREGQRLTWEAYRRLGGVRGAMARRADAFVAGLDAPGQLTVRRIFGRLVQVGEGAADTRRLATRDELESVAPQAGAQVDQLIRERLLTAREDGVEVAHEALIENWATLKSWLREDRVLLSLHADLSEAAQHWDAGQRQDDDLWRGGRLGQIGEQVELGRIRLSPLEAAFVARGQEVEKRNFDAAREFAELIVFDIDRKLRPFAAAAGIRRELLDAGTKLLAILGGESRGAPQVTRLLHHRQRGDLALSHDDLGRARREFERALELAQLLSERAPDHPSNRADLALCYSKLGQVADRAGEVAKARAYLEQARAIAERLVQQTPTHAPAQRSLASNCERLGDLAVRAGDFADARRYFEQALAIQEALAQTTPDRAGDQRGVAFTYKRLSTLAAREGDLLAARQFGERVLVIRRQLAFANPQDARAQRDLAFIYNHLANIAVRAKDVRAAQDYFAAALAIRKQLVRADRQNADFLRDLAFSYNNLGSFELEHGEFRQARHHTEKALRIITRLAAADPENAQYQRDLLFAYQNLTGLALAQADLASARAHCATCQRILDGFAEKGLFAADSDLEEIRVWVQSACQQFDQRNAGASDTTSTALPAGVSVSQASQALKP